MHQDGRHEDVVQRTVNVRVAHPDSCVTKLVEGGVTRTIRKSTVGAGTSRGAQDERDHVRRLDDQ